MHESTSPLAAAMANGTSSLSGARSHARVSGPTRMKRLTPATMASTRIRALLLVNHGPGGPSGVEAGVSSGRRTSPPSHGRESPDNPSIRGVSSLRRGDASWTSWCAAPGQARGATGAERRMPATSPRDKRPPHHLGRRLGGGVAREEPERLPTRGSRYERARAPPCRARRPVLRHGPGEGGRAAYGGEHARIPLQPRSRCAPGSPRLVPASNAKGWRRGSSPEQWGGAGITGPASCRSPPRLAARRLALPGDRGIDLAAVVPTPGRR